MTTKQDLLRMGFVERDGKWERPSEPPRVQSAPISPPYERMVPRREPKPKRMTKCEERWFEELKRRYPYAKINPQFALRVSEWNAPRPVRYTADFAVYIRYTEEPSPYWVELWEVKDRRRKPHSDELVRAKMVREHNEFVSAVWLAEWDGKEWNERRLA